MITKERLDEMERFLTQKNFPHANGVPTISLTDDEQSLEILSLVELGLWAKEHAVPLIKQSRHARACNAPYGQTEKFPTVSAYDQALAALPSEGDSNG